MNLLNDIFESTCRRQFAYLNSFGFELVELLKDEYGCCFTYKNQTLAIKINLEMSQIFIECYILKNGFIPSRPIKLKPHDECLAFDFNDLFFIKTGRLINQNTELMYNRDYLTKKIEEFATELKTHGNDILSGDLSILPKIRARIAGRVKELELEQ